MNTALMSTPMQGTVTSAALVEHLIEVMFPLHREWPLLCQNTGRRLCPCSYQVYQTIDNTLLSHIFFVMGASLEVSIFSAQS